MNRVLTLPPMDAICSGCRTKCDEGFHSGELVYHHWARKDVYGLFTGLYCDDCYESDDGDKYPYRKDEYYDPAYCGERMDDDY